MVNYSLLVLVCTVLVVGSISASEGPAGRGKKGPCCVGVTDLDMSAEVVGETYCEQAARPPCVKAIIFNTEYGPLCADPNAQWVKDLIASKMKV